MKYTINDVARRAGVSKTTVSRVINNKTEGVGKETRERVLAIIEEINFTPNLNARSIVTSQTKTIGLVLTDVTNPFFPVIITEIQAFAMEKGYTVFTCNPNGDLKKEEQYINALAEKRVDGIILTPTSRVRLPYFDMLDRYQIPVILLDHDIPELNCSGVFVDNVKGGYMATKHLLEMGNRKVAFLGGNRNTQSTLDRYEGYCQALKEYRVPVEEFLLSFSDYKWRDGLLSIQDMLNTEVVFDSIVAGCDVMAMGAMKALRKRRIKIPEHVQVVGFDDIPMAELQDPALTTIRQPAKMMARHASSIMIATIEKGKQQPRRVILEPKLIVRETTEQR